MRRLILAIALATCALATKVYARTFSPEDCPTLTQGQQDRLIKEHLFGGAPSRGTLMVRRGYVTVYDDKHRVPRWTAWHAIAEYRNTPPRTGSWATFRTDADVANPVVADDYNGLLASDDLARGHMAPFFIAGGDRDHDGRRAAGDLDDACTVFEINFMSDIAPQDQTHLNGSGGLWGRLESRLRGVLGHHQSFHIIAGTIFGKDPYFVGPEHDIGVPDMFFQIVISDHNEVVPFLFAHPHQLGNVGCTFAQALEQCITTTEDIEDLSGLDFFREFSAADEKDLQQQDGAANWRAIQARR